MKSYRRNFSLSCSFSKYPEAPEAQIPLERFESITHAKHYLLLRASNSSCSVVISALQRGTQTWTPGWKASNFPGTHVWHSAASHVRCSQLPFGSFGERSCFKTTGVTPVLNSFQAPKISTGQWISQVRAGFLCVDLPSYNTSPDRGMLKSARPGLTPHHASSPWSCRKVWRCFPLGRADLTVNMNDFARFTAPSLPKFYISLKNEHGELHFTLFLGLLTCYKSIKRSTGSQLHPHIIQSHTPPLLSSFSLPVKQGQSLLQISSGNDPEGCSCTWVHKYHKHLRFALHLVISLPTPGKNPEVKISHLTCYNPKKVQHELRSARTGLPRLP